MFVAVPADPNPASWSHAMHSKPGLKNLFMTVCLSLCSPLAALAQPPEPPYEHGPAMPPWLADGMSSFGMPGGEPPPPFLRGIDLSEAQQDSIFGILHEQAPAIRERVKILERTEAALRAMVFSAEYDQARARELAESGARAGAQLRLLRLQTDARLFALLTPQQRQLVTERMAGMTPPRGPETNMPRRAPGEIRHPRTLPRHD